jgi:hypothetical protein
MRALVCLIIASLLLAACGTAGTPANQAAAPVEPSAPATIQASADAEPSPPPTTTETATASYDSLAEPVAEATTIVVGRVRQAQQIQDLDGPPGIPDMPSLGLAVTQIYIVEVERYLKDSGPNTITIANFEPRTERDTPLRPAGDALLREGESYLLLLDTVQGMGSEQAYTGGMEPWRFALPDDDLAQPVTDNPAIIAAFPPRPAAELIAEVERLIAAES